MSSKTPTQRAGSGVQKQKGKGNTGKGNGAPNIPSAKPSPAGRGTPSISQAQKTKPTKIDSLPKTNSLEDERSEIKSKAEAAERLGTVEANKQGDIRRLQIEIQYLRGSLDGLHQYIIAEDETGLKKSKPPLDTMDKQEVKLLEEKKREAANKVHESITDIIRLKTENQNLREALNRLHQDIIGGDETAPKKSPTPQETKDYPTLKALEEKFKEVKHKFHEIKTELDYTYNRIYALFTQMDVLVILSQNVKNKTAAHAGTPKNNVVQITETPQKSTQLNKDLEVVKSAWEDMKGKEREAEYTVKLLEDLKKYSGDEGTSISLPKPPIQNERAGSNEGKKGVKQQNDEKPRSGHDEQMQKNFESAFTVLEKLRETNYAALLLEELNKYSKYDANLDTTASLTKPPIETVRAVNNDKKKEDKKLNDDKQISRHEEQLKRNFTSAFSVLEKLREAEYAARLLKELDKYSCYEGTSFNLPGPPTQKALDSSKEGNKGVKKQDVEKPSSEHDEQQQNSFKTASRVLQKMTNVDYAARLLEELDKYSVHKGNQNTTFSLPKPPISNARAGSKDKRREGKGQNDEPPHDEQLQKNFETASSVLETLINATSAQEERDCLLLSLEHLSNVRYPSGGNTDVNIMAILDQIHSSVKKDSSADKGLIHAKEILVVHMDVRSEAEYAAGLLEELNKYSGYEGTHDTLISLPKPPIQTARASSRDGKEDRKEQNYENPRSRHNEQLQQNFESASSVLVKLSELNIVYGRISQISSLLSGNEGGYLPQSTPKIDQTIATGRKGRSIPSQPTNQSLQTLQFEKDVDLITSSLTYLKEKERKHNDLDRKAKQVDEMTVKLQLFRDDNDKIKKEADSLRTRLSEQVGLALTHENPAITDLSDPNRPTKLAEQYSELYDNQWTDAFEILSKHYPKKSDIKLTGLLYGMLVDSYNFCGEVRNKQKQALEDIILYPAGSTQSSQGRKKNEDINRIFAKTLTDAAKLSGNVTGANIAKIFLMSESTKEKYQEWTKKCETYLECCVRLCWLMQVQTPPLCFDVRNLAGKPFDKNCYREYTKGGKTIAFVVWPAMFLHENGPTLCKGIAQAQ